VNDNEGLCHEVCSRETAASIFQYPLAVNCFARCKRISTPGQPVTVTVIRHAKLSDLPELLRLEEMSFQSDRLSRRSFKRWLSHSHCVFLVCEQDDTLGGYVLVLLRRGTRLARMYSLAVDTACRGRGLARGLIAQAEFEAREAGALYMRLEVASNNYVAIELYRRLGYLQFGLYRDYYEDHGDALRMEKCIHPFEPTGDSRSIPWISQSTEFTCGPASLMMAMTALEPAYEPTPLEEIQIWREATTIFMTSGHGGCHPVGLALAAQHRGFAAEVLINQEGPLFVDGVRNPNKKRVMSLVHEAFLVEAKEQRVSIHYVDVDQQSLCERFAGGANVLILISSYRLDRKKAPHWVLLSGYDDSCLYVHDPELEVKHGSAMDCQHVPIAKDEFAAMSCYGGNRLRAAVVISKA
jgi:ribosomal protein S18 acetylase RimI-like enzyme